MSVGWVALGATVVSGAVGYAGSKKGAKAALAAGKEASDRLKWNADEIEKTVAINDQAYAYNIEASEIATDFNTNQLIKESAFMEWQTGFNESIARRGKTRQMGSQIVAMGASGVTTSSSGYDVMRDSEVEMEMQIQADVYTGLKQASRLKSQAEIVKIQGENEAWNLKFQREEETRVGALEAEDTRWQAKIAEMGGQAQASSIKRQGTAQLLNSVTSAASIGNQFGLKGFGN